MIENIAYAMSLLFVGICIICILLIIVAGLYRLFMYQVKKEYEKINLAKMGGESNSAKNVKMGAKNGF